MPVPSSVTPARAMRRPGLVSLLAVLHFLAALAEVMGVLAFARSGQRNVEDWGIAAALAILAVLGLACAWGLWNLAPWGRVLQIGLAWALLILIPVGTLIARVGLILIPIATIVAILLLVFFFKPGAKVLFSGRSPNQLAPEEVAAAWAVTGGAGGMAVAIIAVVLVGVMVMGMSRPSPSRTS